MKIKGREHLPFTKAVILKILLQEGRLLKMEVKWLRCLLLKKDTMSTRSYQATEWHVSLYGRHNYGMYLHNYIYTLFQNGSQQCDWWYIHADMFLKLVTEKQQMHSSSYTTV